MAITPIRRSPNCSAARRQENKKKARKASPVTYVSKNAAPFLIMHGDKDNPCR